VAQALTNGLDEVDLKLRRHVEGRLMGLRVNRYSWWVHYRELADYIIPRRYKWLITPNQMARGSPINQHILDSTGSLAARNCASGIMFGVTDPSRNWFSLKVNRIDSTQVSPVSLWLAEVERLMRMVLQNSNFYNSIAVLYLDLVIFGTGVMIIYEDFEDVIRCFNPCPGEYYIDNSGAFRVDTLYREFTLTTAQCVQQFGLDNCSPAVRRLYESGGSSLTRELVVAHAIEPNGEPELYGMPDHFGWREVYWEWGGSASPQGGSSYAPGLLRKRGFYECPFAAPRWDLVANDAYGRSPGMDALPDIKQLQLETRRKAQAIDKMVNPPMVADVQLKNQPASLLPGGITYIAGLLNQGRPGFAPVYHVIPPIKEMMEDIKEVQERIKETFYNHLFMVISQYETRSNVTAAEIDARRAEAMVMIGPVLERLNEELLSVAIDRVFGIMSRAAVNGIPFLPPPPPDIAGQNIDVEYVSMLEIAQNASAASGIERLFGLASQVAAIDPAATDNIDFDYGFDDYSALLRNNPKLIRSQEQLAVIRQRREAQQEQQARQQQALAAAKAGKDLSGASLKGDNALGALLGAQ